MTYKKPLLWILVLLILVATAVLAWQFTRLEKNRDSTPPEQSLEESSPSAISEEQDPEDWPGITDEGGDTHCMPIEIETDTADYMSYDRENHSLYFVGLNLFEEFSTEEFGYANEGTVSIDHDKNLLFFGVKVATGSVSGALDGPALGFEMDTETLQLLDSNFEPAPDYNGLGLPEFADYSGLLIELDDQRLIEIGQYFKDFIFQLEGLPVG